MIPYGKHDISNEDINAVIEVLRSEYLTQGPLVPLFEETISTIVGAKHAVAANSATSAHHIACMALELGKGDLLWTSPISFVASSNCALYCGAEVDFVDIDPINFNLCPLALATKLEIAEKNGKLPKIVVAVHLCGQSCDMKAISALAKRYQFQVIEDASHAIGAKYFNEYIGNCKYSDITVFSFHPVKIITTAEGGLATTNDTKLSEKMMSYRSHGITRNEELFTKETEGTWYYQQIELGYNYRMTEIQAALGLSQVKRLDEFVAERNYFAKRYDKLLKGLPIILPKQSKDCFSARHLYVIQVKSSSGISRKNAFNALRNVGVGVNVHYIPIHLQPFYQKIGFKDGDFPIAEAYYMRAISLPLFSSMTDEVQNQIIKHLWDIFSPLGEHFYGNLQ